MLKHLARRYKHSKKYLIRDVSAVCVIVIIALIGAHFLSPSHAATITSAPTSPPVQVCGNSSILNGPTSAPGGAVSIPAGNNSSQLASNQLPANTTYYLAAGTHTLGSGQYTQIQPGSGDTFIGAPGAIIDGQSDNNFAFIGDSTSVVNVTIEYLTIQNFDPPGSEGAVNTNSNDGWTIEYDTIQDNVPGSAMDVGGNNTITNNCLTENGEYAFNAYQDPSDPQTSAVTNGPKDINMSDNEISYNDTCNWEASPNFPITSPSGCAGAGENDDCGCDGGGKFWRADQVTYDSNYVHDNYSIGMWADTDNNGFDVEGNYFSNNYGEAIIYEISYNALIKYNTFIDNALPAGPQNPGFPTPAIYISESGGDSRLAGFSSGSLDITDNQFTNNYGGVVLWENPNRYCSSSANSSTGDCTLVNPSVANITTCANATDLAETPYINDCRWKTQNVAVSGNIFDFSPTAIGSSCTVANTCGYNALFSAYGTYAPYTGWVVPLAISDNQNNVFSDNTYNGPWNFMGFDLGETVSWSQWSTGFSDSNGSGDHFNAQDAGSTYDGSAPTQTPPPSTPSNVSAIANSSTSVGITWNASTDSGGPGLGGYDVLRNGTQVGTTNASTTSYTDSNLTAGTQYSYTIKAFDTDSPANVSAASTTSTVTTPSVNQAPTVTITSPANNALEHGTSVAIDTTATAVSGNTISSVVMKVNGTVVQTITSPPYNFTLNTLNYHDGNNTVAITATDNQNNSASQSITVTVTNGDLTGANSVGINDLVIMASNWGKTSGATYAEGDLNGDGKINIYDLSILSSNWGTQW